MESIPWFNPQVPKHKRCHLLDLQVTLNEGDIPTFLLWDAFSKPLQAGFPPKPQPHPPRAFYYIWPVEIVSSLQDKSTSKALFNSVHNGPKLKCVLSQTFLQLWSLSFYICKTEINSKNDESKNLQGTIQTCTSLLWVQPWRSSCYGTFPRWTPCLVYSMPSQSTPEQIRDGGTGQDQSLVDRLPLEGDTYPRNTPPYPLLVGPQDWEA